MHPLHRSHFTSDQICRRFTSMLKGRQNASWLFIHHTDSEIRMFFLFVLILLLYFFMFLLNTASCVWFLLGCTNPCSVRLAQITHTHTHAVLSASSRQGLTQPHTHSHTHTHISSFIRAGQLFVPEALRETHSFSLPFVLFASCCCCCCYHSACEPSEAIFSVAYSTATHLF